MRSLNGRVEAERPYYAPLAGAILAWCEGEFARLAGEPAPDRWTAAARGWKELGLPYDRAYALMREAEATLELRRDRHRAALALAEAAAIARELQAQPLLAAVSALAERARIPLVPEADADAWVAPAAVGPDPDAINRPVTAGPRARRHDLTPREREVVAFLVAGFTDGEIANALFISKKTASFHVATIKGKLGSRSRVEIATDAIGLGLVDAPARQAQ
jgi:DNA-binding CsgD family transcriptional regulator